MANHFTVSRWNVRHGRVWTLLTGAFSHSDLPHLIFNLLTLR